MRFNPARSDSDQGQLRCAGSDCRHKRHLQKVSQQVRIDHCQSLRQLEHLGRTRSKSFYDMDHR